MEPGVKILTYKKLLKNLENKENHLLLANGFNYSLGVNTGYKAIFEKMADNNKGIYKEALNMINECNFDLEYFIGKLEAEINPKNEFLKKYIKNKITLDFMQAVHEIVKSEIKNVYAEKNEGIYLLLKNFTNFFTLNYDSFLYLLLLKYKPIDKEENNSIAFQAKLKFIEDDLNSVQNNIYKEIKEARMNGSLSIKFGPDGTPLKKPFSTLSRTHFAEEVKAYSKANNKDWKDKDINRVIKLIIEEEQRNYILKKVDDGSRQLSLFGDKSEFIFENRATQNLFFLHGAFHIYKDGVKYKKITQETDKALYDKLDEILNNDEQDIVCVFQHENKLGTIQENEYLSRCYSKLMELSGNLVLFGSSLADNDNHIFSQINNSNIEKIYISAFGDKKEIMDIAKAKFPSKEVILFDAETVSYEVFEQELEQIESKPLKEESETV